MLYIEREVMYRMMDAVKRGIVEMRNEGGMQVCASVPGNDQMQSAVLGLLTILTGYTVIPHDVRDISHFMFHAPKHPDPNKQLCEEVVPQKSESMTHGGGDDRKAR